MNTLQATPWKSPRRHPRRVVSLDSLLISDQVDGYVPDQPDDIELQDDIVTAPTSSDHCSTEVQGTTQAYGKGRDSLPHTHKGKPAWSRNWAPEIAALVFAFCCLIAIVAVLAKFNDQQQPKWPYARTLNLSTLVALIATILRSMLEIVLSSGMSHLKWQWFRSKSRPLYHLETFENASRGAWGSLIFVYSLARFNLATLGSIITVLSVIIGTFTQQAIQTVSCQKPSSNGTASIQIAQTSLDGLEQIAGDTGLNKELKASFIAGLAGARQPNSWSPTCSSGNCKFQAFDGVSYSSVGFSSECIDISSLVNQTWSGIDAWVSNGDLSDLDEEAITNYTLFIGTIYELTLSYNLGSQTIGSYGSRWYPILAESHLNPSAPVESAKRLIQNITMTQRQKDIISSPSVDAMVVFMPTTNPCQNRLDYHVDLEYYDSVLPAIKANSCPELDLPGVDTLPGFFSVTAAACFFYPSLQHFELSVTNGVPEEKSVRDPDILKSDVWGDAEEMPCYWCTFVDPCIVDQVAYTNTSANLSSVPGGTTVFRNITGPWRCLYGFPFDWASALMDRFELWDIMGRGDYASSYECVRADNYTSMYCSKSWWFNDIYNGGNASTASISRFMERGFDSLSRQLRLFGMDWDGKPSVVNGTAFDSVVCVVFRWEWLFYPLALIFGVTLLLLLLLVSNFGTRKSGKEVIWKSSVLPFLFYGLEDQFREKDVRLAHQKELKGIAETLNTRFSSGDDGWRFRT